MDRIPKMLNMTLNVAAVHSALCCAQRLSVCLKCPYHESKVLRCASSSITWFKYQRTGVECCSN